MPINKKRVSKILKPDLSSIKGKENKQEALAEIGEFVRDSILDYVGQAESPVSGGKYKAKLSPAYKKLKAKISGNTTANLELHGDMLDALEYEVRADNTLEIGIFDENEAPKAHGHNIGHKKSLRQFIPDPKQNFKKDINDGIKRIISEYASED